jgi:hypothetical protein
MQAATRTHVHMYLVFIRTALFNRAKAMLVNPPAGYNILTIHTRTFIFLSYPSLPYIARWA